MVTLAGGIWPKSKKNPVTSWKGWVPRETVMEEDLLAARGSHLVVLDPSTAESGNWPGAKLSGEETGRHCAMFALVDVKVDILRFSRVMVPWGGI